VIAGAAVLLATAAHAQGTAPARRSATNAPAWLQLFDEHRLDARWSLSLEAQLRRAELAGGTPQQLVLRPGVLYRLDGGAQLGAGYAYAGTSVYGDAPAGAPFPEHRTWQMLQIPGRTGPVAWSHRLRTEQRWIGRVQTVNGVAAHEGYGFRQRARAMTRATVDAPALGVALPKAYLTTWGELLVHMGENPDGQIFDQSRAALQAGWRFGPRFRAEAGYMQQFIQRGGSRVSENNHTLVLSLFAVTGRR
jgi:hypothetical protein